MKKTLISIFVVIFILACNLPGTTQLEPGIAQTPPILQTVPVAISTNTVLPTSTTTPMAFFTTAVIVDTRSEPVTREQAEALVHDANKILLAHTPFGIQMIDFQEDSQGGRMDEIAKRYIASHPDNIPDSIMIFSFGDDGMAKLYGGYAFAVPGPAGYRNPFNSPIEGNTQVYVGVVHFSHKYAACGYAGKDTVSSNVSSNGECRGQDGVACTQHNGYSMCSDALNNLYASTPTYFSASTIVHEILHSFGMNGAMDHYATPVCNEAMKWGSDHFDLAEAQRFNGMCPNVYDNFTNSYQP